jgi:activator of HSP90 ATPase
MMKGFVCVLIFTTLWTEGLRHLRPAPLQAVHPTTRPLILISSPSIWDGPNLLSALSAIESAKVKIRERAMPSEVTHQKVVFKASPNRVYGALTDAQQFNKVTQFSAAVRSGMSLDNKATEISREAGGTFSLFGGYIVGRNIELVPAERIVQAWRAANWDPGVYSIAKFELSQHGSGTQLVFVHTGFPEGQAQHLTEGWKGNYWEPLEKYLA